MRESVTFIHAADLHLGTPFQGLSTDNPVVGRELAEATYVAWLRIVDEAIARDVDFVVIAGDLYDATDPSLRSQLSLREQALRLDEAGIALLLVRGNHDPLAGWSAGLTLPDNVHVFPAGAVERFVVIEDDGFVCAVYGRSFRQAAETEDFTPGYERDISDTVSVGVLHANVGNNPDYDPYAPCTLGALSSRGMDYFALGHIHKHEVLSTDPYVVYAGSPQGLNPKEIGAHGCCLVTLSRSGVTAFEHIEVAPVVWATAQVDLADVDSIDRVEALINARLEGVRASAGRSAAVRVRLTGRAQVHNDLARPGVLAELAQQIRAEQASTTPWVWLDRLTDATASALDIDALSLAPEFSGELVRVAADLTADGAMLEVLVDQVRSPLADKLPNHELAMDAVELLTAARDRALDLLVAEDGGAS